MLQDISIQLIYDEHKRLILVEIKDSMFHIHSLIESNFHGTISNFQPIHSISGKAQTITL
jgi:hypothetical protein